MMYLIKTGVVLITFLFFVLPCFSYEGPVGIQAIERIDLLPKLKTGIRCMQVSSHDRAAGNSDSGYSFYRSGSEYVIFDVIGAGCIYRIWSTRNEGSNSFGNLKFYFDDETTPRINMEYETFFSGNNSPFLTPLVGNRSASCGGYYCYVPIPFSKSLKITCTNSPSFYHITYHVYDSSENIKSFTGTEDISNLISIFNNAGIDPKPVSGNLTVTGSVNINNTETVTLSNFTGPAEIESIKVKFSPNTTQVIRNTYIKIRWDGDSEPAVYSPLGEFFGNAVTPRVFNGLLFGMKTTGEYYNYFPMPYNISAVVQIENKSGINLTDFFYEIQYKNLSFPQEDVGYFYAKHNYSVPTSTNTDYLFLEVYGQGHYVGVTHVMESTGTTGTWYLEGDERFFIDDNNSAMIHGTGTEDFYTGGWYFPCGGFALQLHGNPSHHGWTEPFLPESCYRLQIADLIPFNFHGKFQIEVGGFNDKPANYYSTAFYYLKKSTGMILTDTLDIGNISSENSHNYIISSQTFSGNSTYRYQASDTYNWMDPGYVHSPAITDNGRAHTGYSQFKVNISSINKGVILRRRLDCSINRQNGIVRVDGITVGNWYTPQDNFSGVPEWMDNSRKWLDSEFQIPEKYTLGKTTITVRIDFTGSTSWTEYYYWVYSLLPLTSSPPSQQPSITVLSPDGGESWTVNTVQTVTWTWIQTVGNVNIDLSTNSGTSWTNLVSNTYNDGLQTITVPDTPSSSCRIRVSEIDGTPSDISDGNFSIIAQQGIPVLQVNKTSLDFGEVKFGKTQTLDFEITNIGGGTLTGTLFCSDEWVSVVPENFTAPATVNVTVDNEVLGMKEGMFTSTITINSNGGTAQVTINLTATCVLVKPNPYNPQNGPLRFFGSGIIASDTKINIYTINGEKIIEINATGEKEVIWDGKNKDGENIVPGIYIYTYESSIEKGAGKFTVIKK